MKKMLSTLISTAVLFAVSAMAVDLSFTWTKNPDVQMVTSYKIQQSKAPNTNFVDVVTIPGTTNVGIIRGISAGDYKFRLVAVNGVGTSLPSDALIFPTSIPTQPKDFQPKP